MKLPENNDRLLKQLTILVSAIVIMLTTARLTTWTILFAFKFPDVVKAYLALSEFQQNLLVCAVYWGYIALIAPVLLWALGVKLFWRKKESPNFKYEGYAPGVVPPKELPNFKYEGYVPGVVPPKESYSFSWALARLKHGNRVRRTGWNSSDQWLSVSNLKPAEVESSKFWSPHNHQYAEDLGGSAMVMPCMTIKNAQGDIQMGWVPSQGDLFAMDWEIVE